MLAGAPGVLQVVKLDNAVAVVAEGSYWRAKQALARLQPEWDTGEAGSVDSDKLSQEFRAALSETMLTARNDGDVDQAMSGAAKTFEAIYETPYLSHSPMEPMNATVHLQPDRLDVWVGTQAADEATEAAAKASGLKPEQVYVHNGFVGGGFGRRDASDEIIQAIAIAKVVQRPVKLVWTREEDTRQDKFRPHAVVAFKAAAGADGMPTAWSMRVVTSSIWASVGRKPPAKGPEPQSVAGLADNGYKVPNTRVEALIKNTHLPVWFWRAPGANQHVFAIESFLDEIASASGLDPYQVRRKLLEGKPDWLKVLDTAAEKGDWGKPLPRGTGRGIAICADTDSLCAQVAEVTVKPNGDVKVNRVTVALDTRYMVNPLTIAEQAEGSVIFGLTAALFGKITIKDGAAVQGNFDTYRMVRLAEAPKIDVHLVPSGGKVWGGAGEPATPPIAGAVANAIFAATGKRIRTLADHRSRFVVQRGLERHRLPVRTKTQSDLLGSAVRRYALRVVQKIMSRFKILAAHPVSGVRQLPFACTADGDTNQQRRVSRARRRLRRLPLRQRRQGLCRRLADGHPDGGDLFDQHHAGSRNRHRQLFAGGF